MSTKIYIYYDDVLEIYIKYFSQCFLFSNKEDKRLLFNTKELKIH